ncbi:ATP-binding protein [Rhodanobacter ginsengisoli]|uniref:ATP-binding protein n=1 Tax=Rhodanobacter ginsengisoli TaxID=418646 RepID=A0ABW0QND8_9GAMM
MNAKITNAPRPRHQGLKMAATNISGATEISDEGIKKHFKSIDPYRAIFELVWNGFDAKANRVRVSTEENPLDGTSEVTVLDDGEGIDFQNIKNNFGRFNESDKKEDAAQRGSHGRGRLAFHRLAHEARWYTKSVVGEAIITVTSDNVKWYEAQALDADQHHNRIPDGNTGTLVELQRIFENLPERAVLRQLFSNEFGWFLALNQDKELIINNEAVSVPRHEICEDTCHVGNALFKTKVIRWEEKPSSEKSYTYLLNSSGRTVYRHLSTLNNKPNFFTSVYVQSEWADNFAERSNLFQGAANTPESEEWRSLVKRLAILTRQVYDDFLRKYVDAEIARYEDEGVFPSYTDLPRDYAAWRLGNTKTIVRSIYTADPAVFNSLNKKQKKILVRLLDRLSVSNENESLLDVLNGVLELDQTSVDALASQLKQTTLENIVSTIELLQRRQKAVYELRELMTVHYADVRETPDLQKIIENNTWLFGAQYEILGAEEATFTRVAKGLRDSLHGVGAVDQKDLEGDATIDGANRQPDLFLARKFMATDSFGKRYYRCVVVEIKRPSISLNVKHLRQIEDYAAIIKRHAEFTSEHTYFELILVGRKISDADTEIESRLRNQLHRGETGLVAEDERMKRYVLNWYTLLEGFELTNGALLERLKLQRDNLSSNSRDQLVNSLQS